MTWRSLTLAASISLFVVGNPPARGAEAKPDVLSEACTTCHGPGGRSPGQIPSIDGLGTSVMKTLLLGFKRDEIPATVMNRLSKGFSDSEIDAIATYLGRGRP